MIATLIAAVPVYSQQSTETQPLEIVLTKLQEQTGYQFNYAPEIIENIVCTQPDADAAIAEILEHLQRETGLSFSILSDDIISVKDSGLKICGYLKDGLSNEPIAFAAIWSGENSTNSNEEGFFELVIDPLEPLNFRHISYVTKKAIIEPGQGGCLDVHMDMNQQMLPEIVLSDYLIAGIDKLNNGSYQMDFEEFTILPGLIESDVLQSVQALPGILSVNETVSNINVRGGSHDQNLILWDHIKMYQSGHFFGLISMYNPQITQRVSLRKNGTPAASSDGVSGTIEMETSRQVNEKIEGNVGINFIDANAFLDIPLGKKSSVQASVRKSISEFVKTPTYSQYFDRISQDTEIESDSSEVVNSDINFDFFDGSLRWIFKPTSQDEIRVNFLYAGNDLVFNENALVDSQLVSRESSLDQTSIAGGVSYDRIWNDRHQTSFHLYESDYKLRAINANILQNQRFLQENKVSETGVGIVSNYRLDDHIQWSNGYRFTETKVTNLDDVDNPIYRKLTAEVVRAHGVFSEVGLVSKDQQTNLNLGGRLNYLEKFEKFIFEPRLSFNHNFSSWWNLEILGEFKHQYTSQIINFQNDFLGIEKRRWQLSDNDTIPVITSKQVSAGISFGKHGWLINGVVFYKDVDGISSQSQGFQNQYEFVKTAGSYRSLGLDLLIRKQLERIDAWLSYSFLDSEYDFKELEISTFPSNFDITHAVSLGATYQQYPFLFSAGINWHTGKPTTRPTSVTIENQIDYDSPNSDRLMDYLRVDLSAVYQFTPGEHSRGEIGFSIWNLFDRDNAINNFYQLNDGGEPEETIQKSLGITPNLTLRYYF